jgi:hypothetical protein
MPGPWTENACLEDGHGGDWEEGSQFSLLCAKLRGESQKFECCRIKLHSPQQVGKRGLGTAKRQRTQRQTQDRGTVVMAEKQSTNVCTLLGGRQEREAGTGQKKLWTVWWWNVGSGPGPRRRQPCLLRILRSTGDEEVSNASARDCEDWGFQKAGMEEKRGRRIGIRSGVQADEIKRLGGLGERNGLSGHLDAFVA